MVTLATANPQPVTVRFGTTAGSASAPADYTGTSGTLTFPAGTTTRTVPVPGIGDTLAEGVRLSLPTNAGIADASGTSTIRNDA